MAFKINIPKEMCVNENPHITICTFHNKKPYFSNLINKWIKLNPIEIKLEMYLVNDIE